MKPMHLLLAFTTIMVLKFILLLPGWKPELDGWHSWRQTYTQTNIINFYEEDFNIFHPRSNNRGSEDGIYRMEFPLMQWIVASGFKLFGPSVELSRAMNFLFSIITCIGIFGIIWRLSRDKLLALIGVWCCAFAPSFFYFSICPMPDNLALTFGTLGLYYAIAWNQQEKYYQILLSGMLLSLGALCKLPFILLYALPFGFLLQKLKSTHWQKQFMWFSTGLASVTLPFLWYNWVIPQWGGNGILYGFTKSKWDVILHYSWRNIYRTLPELIIGYSVVVLFSVGVIQVFRSGLYRSKRGVGFWFLWLALCSYAVFEVTATKDYHDYYWFPFYPLVVIITAFGTQTLLRSRHKFWHWLVYLSLLALPITTLIRMQENWSDKHLIVPKEYIESRDVLRNAVPKDALCIITRDDSRCMKFYYIDKKGWALTNWYDYSLGIFPAKIHHGAKYIYCDDRAIDTVAANQVFLDTLIAEVGVVKIYRLISPEEVDKLTQQ